MMRLWVCIARGSFDSKEPTEGLVAPSAIRRFLRAGGQLGRQAGGRGREGHK